MTFISAPESVESFRRNIKKLRKRCYFIPPRTTIPEWADNYRVLSGKSSARPGDFRTSRVEIARGPMMAVTEPGVQTISLMVATQLLKTTFIENTIGYFMHIDPCPMLMVYPDEDAAEAFSKERLAAMVEVTPVLKERIGNPRSRKAENTIEVKHFPGGFVAMASARSPMSLSARPIRIVFEDEIDKYVTNKEGDPLLLAEERSSTFPKRLAVRASSPTTEETSRIYASYLQSDQRRPYVRCPHCGWWQYLEFFRHVHWEKDGGQHNPATAAIWCEHCHTAWTEEQRRVAIQEIRWQQTRTFVCCDEGQDPRQTRAWEWCKEHHVGYAICQHCKKRAVSNVHAGFTASKLYSPFPTDGDTIVLLASRWLDCKDSVEARQTFYNTQLALPYKTETAKEASSAVIAARREVWTSVLPDRVCVLTAGVDVQSGQEGSIGRLEAEVVGWDPYEESWSLAYEIFTGDPAKPEVWEELDDFLLKPWERSDGRGMRILGTCIDSGGHHTEEVYKFALARMGRNVWATKGAADRGGQWSPVWPAKEFRKFRNRITHHRHRPVIIGVNAAKEAIRQRLLIDTPGPGYCHFPAGRPSGYFDQLTAERLVVERKHGAVTRRWEQLAHRANEALDTRVLAYAALQGLINERGFKPGRVANILSEPRVEEEMVQEPLDTTEPVAQEVAQLAPQPPLIVPGQRLTPPPGAGRMAGRVKVVSTRSRFMSGRYM